MWPGPTARNSPSWPDLNVTPPEDLDVWIEENGSRLEAPESVTAVERTPMTGTVLVSRAYFRDDTCTGAFYTDRLTFTVSESP